MAGCAAGEMAEVAKRYSGIEDGRLAGADLGQRITRNKMDFQALRQTIGRTAAEARASNGPSAATSIIKYAAAEFAKQPSELMVEALGSQGLGGDGEGFTPAELELGRASCRERVCREGETSVVASS